MKKKIDKVRYFFFFFNIVNKSQMRFIYEKILIN